MRFHQVTLCLSEPPITSSDKPTPSIKAAQVHRYSLLYWYVPWIERTIATDINRQGELAYDDESNITGLTATTPSNDLSMTIPSEYFHVDSAYDDLSMNINPCGDESTRSTGRSSLQTARLGLAFFAGVTISLRAHPCNYCVLRDLNWRTRVDRARRAIRDFCWTNRDF